MLLLRTLLSHYRRHPVQALFLLVGIAIANVLLVGTLLINAQARASYAEGEQLLRAQALGTLRARDGARAVDERAYIELRRQGHDYLAPLLRRFVRLPGGETVELLGIDAFAMPRADAAGAGAGAGAGAAGGDAAGMARSGLESDNRGLSSAGNAGGSIGSQSPQFAQPPFAVWGSPARLRQLGWREGSRPQLASGLRLPPVVAVADAGLGHRLLLDIGALQELTDSRGELSGILVFDAAPGRIQALQQDLGTVAAADLEWSPSSDGGLDPGQLTRSFHLNLAAMGLLAFVVGVFLIYNALAFSYTDRRELLRKLRLAGVTRGELAQVLLLELAVFVLVGSALGYVVGSWLAALLLPGVGLTLAQLYGVYIAYPDGWLTGGLGLPLAMTGLATLLCVLFPLREALAMPLLERQTAGWGLRAMARRDRVLLLVGSALLVLSALLAAYADALWLALACMACLLLGAALCLPATLRAALAGLACLVPARRARAAWLVADSRWLLGPASLALMAITLALVANSGLNTMIGSFRDATDRWLQQRLVAQIYLAGDADPAVLRGWLEQQADDVSLAERYSATITAGTPAGASTAVEIISMPLDERFLASVGLMQAEPGARDRFRDGQGLYISERAWRLGGWQTGAAVDLCPRVPPLPVLGIYRDYGNPQSQWMVSPALFARCWPDLRPAGYGLIGPDALPWQQLRADLVQATGYDDSQVVDQQELMARALGVFDRTFTVTHALNALTLLVAGIGIFSAVSAIHHHRLPQQALLTTLGVSRRERAVLLLLQWGLLGLLCVLLVWPFGTALAWVLSSVVTPVAFGWSFDLQLAWQHLPLLALLAAGSLLLAVLVPSLQLLRVTPGTLLRSSPV